MPQEKSPAGSIWPNSTAIWNYPPSTGRYKKPAFATFTLTDEVIELHERILGSLFSRAKRTQAERLQQTGKLIQSKLKQYVTVGQALLNARESGEDPWAAIEDVLPWQEFINSVEETRFLSRKDNFDPLHLITEKYSTLRKYAPRMLAALQFMAAPAAIQLSDALDIVREMYRKQLRKVPPSAPTGFIPESWRKVVITPSGIDRKYYEFCVLNELKGALRSGDIWVKGSRRYRNFDDYLIPSGDFEKSLLNNQLPLAIPADCNEYIESRMTLLAARLKEVNAMALTGDLPDVDISDKGLKITPLDNSVSSAVSPFADLVYGMLPHPKITEMLDEVDGWTGFTHHFTHLKNHHVRPKDRKLLLTTILADGINLGLTKMAESCPGTTKSSLEGIQAWYIRDETYSAALAELVNAQKKRPLAFYSDKASVFRINNKQSTGGDGQTQFGRAMNELNITGICANTSSAKGRIERAHLTLQDRLVKELRLRGISTPEAANAFAEEFMADYNHRFAKPPRHDFDVHRPLENNENLAATFTWREQRKVSKSLTLQYDKKLYLLEDNEENRRFQGEYIDVWQYPDGNIELQANGTSLPFITYDRLGELDQGAIVDNKRLGRALEMIKLVQDKRDNNRSQALPSLDGQTSRRKKQPGKKSQRSLNQDDMLEALQQIQTRSQEIFGKS